MFKKFFVSLFWLILSWFGGNNEPKATTVKIIPVLTEIPTISATPEVTLAPIPSQIIKQDAVANINSDDAWGVAKQIDEHTWTMKVGLDDKMADPKEVFEALNEYRRQKGVAVLMWDDKLTDYAMSRAEYFSQIKGLDGHAGFNDYLENEDGFEKLGFSLVGENSSYGYRMSGTHLIEWIYGADKPHDNNQKDSRWAYVGIGVDGTSNCIIFGTGKK